MRLTLDTGAETSMTKSSLACPIGATIEKSSQQVLEPDGVTPLAVVGKTRLILFRAEKQLALDALVGDDLNVDALAGTPFLIANNITDRPAKGQARIQDSEVITTSTWAIQPLLPMLWDVRKVTPYVFPRLRLLFGLVNK